MVSLKHQIGRGNPSESGVQMRPKEKQKTHEQPLIGASRLDLMLNMEHELVRLAEAINSEHFVGGGTGLMVWVGAAVPTGEMRC